jgi:3-demethoxyubiquinol 3-hydroxylase
MTKIDDQVRQTIARILKVNHAGECGAIRIYAAQIFVAGWLYPDLVPELRTFLLHEKVHCQAFLDALNIRKGRPCAAMSLWSTGGTLLGLGCALLGRNAIMVCTQAVEQTVHRHLQAQIAFLSDHDEPLRSLIESIRVQELEHLDYARERIKPSFVNAPLCAFIEASTEIVIWLSTQGAVSRMEKALR